MPGREYTYEEQATSLAACAVFNLKTLDYKRLETKTELLGRHYSIHGRSVLGARGTTLGINLSGNATVKDA